MAAEYEFIFVAVQSDGDINCNQYPDAVSLNDLGKEGFCVVGMIPESSVIGYGHTLIMQRKYDRYYDPKIDAMVYSDPL